MIAKTTLRAALSDDNLLGKSLKGESFANWRALLLAAMGERLLPDELEAFRRLTGGRYNAPERRVNEFWGVIGRRGGKSRSIGVLAAYIATLTDHSLKLAPGERGVVLLIAPDQRQARILLDYAVAAIAGSPVLAQLIANETHDSLELTNGVSIEVRAASFRRLRGVTSLAVIADEAAFWHSDETSANADSEILNAVRPSLLTTGGLLTVISSPYAKRGEVYETYKRHFGPKGNPRILVAQGTSRDLNPTLKQSDIDKEIDRDPDAASAEYLAQFRNDISAFISREIVESCVDSDVRERPPLRGIHYFAFCDPSGGSSDSMTLAIGHMEGERVVVDALRETRAPFSPESTVADFAKTLHAYGVHVLYGDRYAGEWPRERFATRSISYIPAPAPKSDLFRDLLPRLNAGTIVLPNNDRLVNQFVGLERRVSRAGRDSIDHSPGMHDDLANAVAGLAALSGQQAYSGPIVGSQTTGHGTTRKTRVIFKNKKEEAA